MRLVNRLSIGLLLTAAAAFAQYPIPGASGGGGGGGGCVAGTGITCVGSTISVDTAVIESRATAQSGASTYCRSTTGSATMTCALTPTLTAYTTGSCLSLNADFANVTTATLDVDALGVKSVLNRSGAALAAGDIPLNKPVGICYDGTQWIVHGSGSGITIPFTNYVPAAKCQSGAAGLSTSYPVTNAPTAFCDTTATNAVFATARFTATAQSIQDHFRLPADQTGALDFWISTRAVSTTGNQLWDLQTACVATAEAFNPTFNTAQTITIATAGTTLQQTTGSQAGVTQTGCAAGEVLMWKLTLSASTTTTGNIDLIEYGWTVRRTI